MNLHGSIEQKHIKQSRHCNIRGVLNFYKLMRSTLNFNESKLLQWWTWQSYSSCYVLYQTSSILFSAYYIAIITLTNPYKIMIVIFIIILIFHSILDNKRRIWSLQCRISNLVLHTLQCFFPIVPEFISYLLCLLRNLNWIHTKHKHSWRWFTTDHKKWSSADCCCAEWFHSGWKT